MVIETRNMEPVEEDEQFGLDSDEEKSDLSDNEVSSVNYAYFYLSGSAFTVICEMEYTGHVKLFANIRDDKLYNK